jgi:hypothetical protein
MFKIGTDTALMLMVGILPFCGGFVKGEVGE